MASTAVKMTCFSKLKKAAQASLDADTSKEMSRCLLKLTTSGNPSLDDVELKHFKKMCRKSDDYVRYAFMMIMEQLQKKHSEIRLSAFQVAAEIFNRSHAFREILITHLQDFLTLTTGTETNQPLPPPKAAAIKLKECTLRTMQQWYDNFGKSYRKLAVGYNYLKDCKHVDFQNIQAQNEAERLRTEQEAKRKQKQIADRLAKVLQDIADGKSEIENCVREAENCLALLLPTPDNFLMSNLEDLQPSMKDQKTDQTDSFVTGTKYYSPGTGVEEIDYIAKVKAIQDVDGNKNVEKAESHQPTVLSCDEEDRSDTKMKTLNESSDIEAKTSSKEIDKGDSGCDKDISSHRDFELRNDSDALDYFDFEEEEEGSDSDDNEFDRAHGFSKPGYSINIEMPIEKVSVKETEDNTDVLQSLKDAAKLVNSSFLPKVTKWLEALGKFGAKQDDIKTMIDLKRSLETIKTKCTELKLVTMEKLQDTPNSDDDDDLEDVPEKEGYEATVPSDLRQNVGFKSNRSSEEKSNLLTVTALKRHSTAELSTSTVAPDASPVKKSNSCGSHWNLKDREMANLNDPTSRAAALARIQSSGDVSKLNTSDQPSTSNSETTAPIPFVEFGKDLAYWDNPDEIEAPSIIKFDSLHRFWASGNDEAEKASQHDVSLMLNRTFNYTGQFEPVKWSCRAPLTNGKLCPRMDRVKCPFHGPIIPRDNEGKPSAIDNRQRPSMSTEATTCTKTNSELKPWQDPELQREIEQATGHDLGSARSQKLLDKAISKGKGKGKRTKKSGLTNLKAASNTSRKRLEKRVFHKGSLKRVCANLDAADFRRVRDKFGNQFKFNYSL